jgi:hypothetical protein
MNILKWFLVIAIAYAVGYFSRSPEPVVVPEVIADCLRLDAFKEVQSALQEGQERLEQLETAKAESKTSSSKVNEQEKVVEQPASDQLRQSQAESSIAAPYVDPNQQQASQATSNISNEEIDKLVPVPYNEILKRMNGPIREKYKEFAESNQQEDWDRNTQNRITDALLGHSYSKFIELESVTCKASLCEVRGRELKPQVINLIFAELQLQEWWDMGASHLTTGMDKVFYGLLMRRPAVIQQE